MSTVTPEIMLSWPTPNYVDPVTLTGPILAVNAIAIVLMTIFLVARFYARLRIVQKALGADDWIILAAYVSSQSPTEYRGILDQLIRFSGALYGIRNSSYGRSKVWNWSTPVRCRVQHDRQYRQGMESHMLRLRSSRYTRTYTDRSFPQATLVSQATISSVTALIKISICFSYLQLFPKNLSGWFNYSMIGILAAYAISSAFAAGFQCW